MADTFSPLVLAVLQIGTAFSVDNEKWWILGLNAWVLAGAMAYENAIIKLGGEDGIRTRLSVKNYTGSQRLILIVSAALAVVAGAAHSGGISAETAVNLATIVNLAGLFVLGLLARDFEEKASEGRGAPPSSKSGAIGAVRKGDARERFDGERGLNWKEADDEQWVGRLDRERFRDRMRIAFGSSYFLITSIIQGAAASVVFVSFAKDIVEANFSSMQVIYWGFTIMAIVIVVFEYVTVAALFLWAPRHWDILIPVLIGGSEILMAVFLYSDRHAFWWFALSFLLLASVGAFRNSYRRMKGKFGWDAASLKVEKESSRSFRKGSRVCAFGAVVASVVGTILSWEVASPGSRMFVELVGLLILIVISLVVIRKEAQWLEAVHREFGFSMEKN